MLSIATNLIRLYLVIWDFAMSIRMISEINWFGNPLLAIWSGNKTRLKANYGTAYNAPNVYYYLNRADDNLAPEQSRGFDLGFEQTSLDRRLWYGISYFQNDVRDQFDWNN